MRLSPHHQTNGIVDITNTAKLIREAEQLTGTLSLKISAKRVVSACPVETCMGVLLFSLVERELSRTLYTRLTTSGHSSTYILSSDSTAREARMTCLQADSIVQFDHEQFAIVKWFLVISSFCTRHMLCAAKDEISVDTMRRMFCCNFLRKSRL
jgi:hypothetical protein